MDKANDDLAASTLLKRFIWGALTVCLVWALSGFLIFKFFPGSPDERGTFGDMFGAVNALFSGLAFLGVVLAILLQHRELREQRVEFRSTRLAQEASARALERQLAAQELRDRAEAMRTLIESRRRSLAALAEPRSVREHLRRKALTQELDTLEVELGQLLATSRGERI